MFFFDLSVIRHKKRAMQKPKYELVFYTCSFKITFSFFRNVCSTYHIQIL